MRESVNDWTVVFDALEQWVRSVGDAANSGDGSTSPAPELPYGPVPTSLVGRALALQSAMEDAQVLGRESRRRLTRQSTYATA